MFRIHDGVSLLNSMDSGAPVPRRTGIPGVGGRYNYRAALAAPANSISRARGISPARAHSS